MILELDSSTLHRFTRSDGVPPRDFLKEPLGDLSHHLLHTSYAKRGVFVWNLSEAEPKESVLQE